MTFSADAYKSAVAYHNDTWQVTHPAPIKRMLTLARHFFGAEVADAVAATYISDRGLESLEQSLNRLHADDICDV